MSTEQNRAAGTVWSKLKLNSDALIPVITVADADDKVLMLAYMDEEALTKTFESGLMHYHSRSRNELWLKGKTSGHLQHLVSCQVDCDADTLLFRVHADGPACHTGAASCFYRDISEL